MAKIKQEEKAQPIAPKTPKMEALLQAGFGDMNVTKANKIIAERKADFTSWPWAMLERADAFLAAYNATPIVIAKNPGWKRSPANG